MVSNNKLKFASLFTGGGLADIGAMQAGCEIIWGVELKEQIAAVAAANLQHKVHVKSVSEMDWENLEKPDILWASPPCPNFSIAKIGAEEASLDVEIANSVCKALDSLCPQVFILENVEGYKRSQSIAVIQDKLASLGYWFNWEVVNAADYGVPQTRRRLILRAIRGGFLPALPLPNRSRRGWHEAISDLIEDLSETTLAQWQIDKMPDALTNVLIERHSKERSRVIKESASAPTVCSSDYKRLHRAVLWNRNTTERSDYFRDDNEPSYCVTTNAAGRTRASLLDRARVVQLDSRCLARFQTVPDWYQLPENSQLACTIIGNGVPCELARQIIDGLLNHA